MSALDPALDALYRQAEYVIFVDEQSIVTCIDVPSTRLAQLLVNSGVETAALITAANPRSCELPLAENIGRQQQLSAELKRRGVSWLSAVGRSVDGRWQEPSLLVLGLPADDALALCLQFEQHAWVGYDADGCGELLVTDVVAAMPRRAAADLPAS